MNEKVVLAIAVPTAISLMFIVSFLAKEAYYYGYAEGETSVACAPPDYHLNDLLACYKDRSILSAKLHVLEHPEQYE